MINSKRLHQIMLQWNRRQVVSSKKEEKSLPILGGIEEAWQRNVLGFLRVSFLVREMITIEHFSSGVREDREDSGVFFLFTIIMLRRFGDPLMEISVRYLHLQIDTTSQRPAIRANSLFFFISALHTYNSCIFVNFISIASLRLQ